MEKLNSLEIRKKFLDYFEKNNHLKIEHASIVPKNDPTLLFINSGMAPLKNYFLGREAPPSPRLANFQPCIRTKDIDDVGDRHHLTIFEMMGSWSIGDYYKDRACELAYDLLVKELGFPAERLYFTVYGGNEKLGIAPDNESVEAWKKCGVPEDHIVMLGDDNFWGPAGDTGPCGPCTEVFFDTGEEYGPKYTPGGHFDDVSRYIEIWNAGVFMELNKQKDGSFQPLPLKSVDTGSGLERLAMVMNGFDSVYETDLMQPLMNLSKKLLGEKSDVSTERMISDHMRASVMILAEGVMPGNEGQGYIPRRLIRKCVAACIARGVKKPSFNPFIDKIVELLGEFYPQLKSAKDSITYNIEQEVKDFVSTIKTALVHMNTLKVNDNTLSGKDAFELVTTHGMPYDVVIMFAKDKGWNVDEASYDKHYEEHRKTSRVISRKSSLTTDQAKLEEAFLSDAESNFSGYSHLKENSKVVKMFTTDLVDTVKSGEEVYFSTESTPFYGESGGQAGDIGYATSVDGVKLEVFDTMKFKGTHVHVGKVLEGELKTGDVLELSVDVINRNSIMRNHSATHLLHSALHQVVGKHAVQKGSSVSSDRLRFDFQNPGPVSKEELDEIELIVNSWVMNNADQGTKLCSYDEAIDSGAMALFGEKYDSEVRVISFGPESVELCGGTHVKATGDIGLFLITSESSVAKGIRRIEAVTGTEAIQLMQERNNQLKAAADEMKSKPAEVATKIKELKVQMKQKIKEAKESKGSSDIKVDFETSFEANGVSFYGAIMNAESEAIKEKGDSLLNEGPHKVICLISKEEKTLRTFMWSHQEVNKKVKAGDALKKVLESVNGRGGGRPNFAQGGSPEVENVDKLQKYMESDFKEWLASSL